MTFMDGPPVIGVIPIIDDLEAPGSLEGVNPAE